MAEALQAAGIAAGCYHAQLEPQPRLAVHQAWSAGTARCLLSVLGTLPGWWVQAAGAAAGALQIVAATVAFGMGIDQPNTRFVIHASPSKSMESALLAARRALLCCSPVCCTSARLVRAVTWPACPQTTTRRAGGGVGTVGGQTACCCTSLGTCCGRPAWSASSWPGWIRSPASSATPPRRPPAGERSSAGKTPQPAACTSHGAPAGATAPGSLAVLCVRVRQLSWHSWAVPPPTRSSGVAQALCRAAARVQPDV